jgi:glycosyltransferase involved in cell wall biosynthesis
MIPFYAMTKKSGFSIAVVFSILRAMVRHRTRVIHSHDLGALIYAVLVKICTLGIVRVVHTQHSFIHLEKSPRYQTYEKFFTAFANEVCTVSESLKEQYDTVGVDPTRVRVIPNGVELPQEALLDADERASARKLMIETLADPVVAQALEKEINSIWVLCMARVHPKKGQEHVVDLWARLDPTVRARAVLIFVGSETFDGALSVLKNKMAALGPTGRLYYAGFTHEPLSWLKISDLYVSGSEFEGMPLGPIEAIGSGLKTLVSDIPGHSMLPTFVEKFDLADQAAGAKKLEKLILQHSADEASAAWEMGKSARERFGIPTMVKRYEQTYQHGGV